MAWLNHLDPAPGVQFEYHLNSEPGQPTIASVTARKNEDLV